eukprot:gnl/TRDRNA2_/TRDRNA2_44192_c0_seq1.p1 gnl/TRDRNA2_/TRDRNA2_44192_c0~~gnl/TRDRNA2_/TRDRNA2_44192_c0_seq1.p1  ORF type:complete len:100 (-),score=2.15 gnl/TRDRNA2_/TRDRNA2_44192_c0_seq1:82-381(-)
MRVRSWAGGTKRRCGRCCNAVVKQLEANVWSIRSMISAAPGPLSFECISWIHSVTNYVLMCSPVRVTLGKKSASWGSSLSNSLGSAPQSRFPLEANMVI